MKKIIYLSFLAVLFLMSCGLSKNDVILVNDVLVSKAKKVSNAEKLFFEVCRTYNAEKISAELKTFTETSKTVEKEIEGIEVHKDLNKLKESVLTLVKTYIAEEADYKEYARINSIPTASFTVEDEKDATANSTKINNTVDMAFAEFNLTQKEFGNKYGYVIEKKKEIKKLN